MDKLRELLNSPDGLTLRQSVYNGITAIIKDKSGSYEIVLTEEDKENLVEILMKG